MGLFNFWKKPKKEKKEIEFPDDTELKRLESTVRRQRNEIYRKKLQALKDKQEQQLLEMQIKEAEESIAEFYDDNEEDDDEEENAKIIPEDFLNPDALITSLLMQFINKTALPQVSTPPPLKTLF